MFRALITDIPFIKLLIRSAKNYRHNNKTHGASATEILETIKYNISQVHSVMNDALVTKSNWN